MTTDHTMTDADLNTAIRDMLHALSERERLHLSPALTADLDRHLARLLSDRLARVTRGPLSFDGVVDNGVDGIDLDGFLERSRQVMQSLEQSTAALAEAREESERVMRAAFADMAKWATSTTAHGLEGFIDPVAAQQEADRQAFASASAKPDSTANEALAQAAPRYAQLARAVESIAEDHVQSGEQWPPGMRALAILLNASFHSLSAKITFRSREDFDALLALVQAANT